MMVECSSDRRSKTLMEPSLPTDANTLVELWMNLTSNTSESWAISWVLTLATSRPDLESPWARLTSHKVQVVSTEEVMMMLGSVEFQSNEVTGGSVLTFSRDEFPLVLGAGFASVWVCSSLGSPSLSVMANNRKTSSSAANLAVLS